MVGEPLSGGRDETAGNFAALLEVVQAVARTGLHYSRDFYDRQRYELLAELAAKEYGRLGGLDPAAMREGWAADIGAVTPKVGADAAIFDGEERLLVMKRADNLRWCMPCGLCEPLESPAETAVREAWEETGLRVEVAELVGVWSRPPDPAYTPYTLVSIVYLCDVVGGELRGSHEDVGLEWRHIEDVEEWHANQLAMVQAAREAWRRRA